MSGENCKKKYFNWIDNSCYIDCLFVSLFNSKNILIDNFVNNLNIKQHNDKLITNKDLEDLQYYAIIIQTQIQDIYKQLSVDHTDDKQHTCINFRHYLQLHSNIINKYYNNSQNFINDIYNPTDILLYLYEYVFIDNNNITNISCTYYDYTELNFDFDKKTLGNDVFSDINFITISKFDSNLTQLLFKEKIIYFGNLHLHLHSIIVNTGSHYVCYYKCNNIWYYYNDTSVQSGPGNAVSEIIIIGTIYNVNEHIKNIIDKLENKEIFLLYLKEPSMTYTQHPVTNSENQSIIQLKKLLNDHFERLKELIK
jgi:hypothetical protein